MMKTLTRTLTDLRSAARSLRRNSALSLIMVATLAIGLGANTTIFSLVKSVLFVGADFGPNTDRLLSIHSVHPTRAQQLDDATLSWPEFEAVRATGIFERVEAWAFRNLTLGLEEGAVRANGASITPGLFESVGARPALGRGFADGDAAPIGFESTVILSDALWRRQYGANPAIVGTAITINGRSLEVIGVMAESFAFPDRQELWMAYKPAADARPGDRFLHPLGISRAGETSESATSRLQSLSADLEARWPETQKEFRLKAATFPLSLVGGTPRAMTALVFAVILVLLIACANLAALLIARGIERRREHALKSALGASSASLVRELLAEVLLLSVAGAGLGWMFATWAVPRVVSSFPEAPPYWMRFDVDIATFGYCLALTLFTTIAAGLLPAIRAAAIRPAHDLRDSGRAVTRSLGTRAMQEGVVAAQVAACLALVVSAQLMIESFNRLQKAESGVREEGLLTARLYLSGNSVDEPAAKARAIARLIEGVESRPGVLGAALTTAIPADDGGPTAMIVKDVAALPTAEIPATVVGASPGLFETLGGGLRRGRAFTAEEFEAPTANSVIVSESVASQLGGDVVGRSIAIRSGTQHDWRIVVGVAPDIQYEEFGEETRAGRRALYVPYARLGWRSVELTARTSGPPDALVRELRSLAKAAHPGIALFDTRTMAQVRESTTWDQRFFARMMSLFAGVALLLAGLGLYGMLRRFVNGRTHEIGIRRALGASAGSIGGLVVSRAAFVAGIGVVAGSLLAAVASRGLSSLLFGAGGVDPLTVAVAGTAIVALVLLCSVVPVSRALRVDPIVALREE